MARVLLSAPKSGSGKTMVTCGLMRLLSRKGMKVQGIKCGPDYIDPMFHRQVLGIPCGNIDTFFTDEETTRMLLGRHGQNADITILEGVMGYYDGIGGMSVDASTYDVARVTDTPVILVVDGKGSSVTLAAVIRGIMEFREDSHIQGVILNRVSKGYYPRIKQVIEDECKVQVIGFLPELKNLEVPSRHLGLVSPEEIPDFMKWADCIGDELEENVDVGKILEIAQMASCLKMEKKPTDRTEKSVLIGIAQDEAFSFYYEENRMLLRELGARLVPFSPLRDPKLPTGIQGMILGGGYPEKYAKLLMENESMRKDILEKCESGMPVMAECGGFLYLQKTLQGTDGNPYEMVGVLPGEGYPTGKSNRFGYVSASISKDGLLGECGDLIRGHEFHYWDCTQCGEDFCMEKPKTGVRYNAMIHTKTMAAGFPHFYYYSNPDVAKNFLKVCAEYKGIM